MKITNLYKAPSRTPLRIVSLHESHKSDNRTNSDDESVALLENLGLRSGTLIKVKTRYIFGGPVLLNVEDAYSVAVGKDVAEKIMVAAV